MPPSVTPLVDGAAVADLDRLAEDDAHPVIYEHALADRRSRMDLDAGEKADEIGEKARKERHARTMERVNQAMRLEGLKSGIEQNDLEPVARGGVAFERRAQIGEKGLKRPRHLD